MYDHRDGESEAPGPVTVPLIMLVSLRLRPLRLSQCHDTVPAGPASSLTVTVTAGRVTDGLPLAAARILPPAGGPAAEAAAAAAGPAARST